MNALAAAIMRPLCAVKRWPFTVLFGALLGVGLIPVFTSLGAGVVVAYYDARPIVSMTADVIDEAGDQIILRVQAVRRAAPECRFVRLVAYTIDTTGQLQDATIHRQNAAESGITRPPGTYDLGVWVIKPKSDGKQVRVDAVYECGGRLIINRALMVPLK